MPRWPSTVSASRSLTEGTIGGALAVGRSGIRRLGWGPVRDTVLQARYVSAAGDVVKAGGPTVKNVSGFDLCRLLVGSRGTLGFLAEVILRTRPLPVAERWYTSERDPWELLTALYRPTSMLWDGDTTWILLDGHADDVATQVQRGALTAADGPPDLPPNRWSLPPSELRSLADEQAPFVAELGVGVVHHSQPSPQVAVDPAIRRAPRPHQARVRPDRTTQSGRRRARRPVNAALRAYVDRPVGDLEAALRAAVAAAGVWGLDDPTLVRAGMNAIFTAGPVVLRVSAPSAPAEVSLELAEFWHDHDVAVPHAVRDDVVRIDGLSVTAWERIGASETPRRLDPSR